MVGVERGALDAALRRRPSLLLARRLLLLAHRVGPRRPDVVGLHLEITPFNTIPRSFWWVLTTTTTVGYGDLYPTTVWGKILGMVTQVVGILVLALPITVIGANFASEFAREENRQASKKLREKRIQETRKANQEQEELLKRQQQAEEEDRKRMAEAKRSQGAKAAGGGGGDSIKAGGTRPPALTVGLVSPAAPAEAKEGSAGGSAGGPAQTTGLAVSNAATGNGQADAALLVKQRSQQAEQMEALVARLLPGEKGEALLLEVRHHARGLGAVVGMERRNRNVPAPPERRPSRGGDALVTVRTAVNAQSRSLCTTFRAWPCLSPTAALARSVVVRTARLWSRLRFVLMCQVRRLAQKSERLLVQHDSTVVSGLACISAAASADWQTQSGVVVAMARSSSGAYCACCGVRCQRVRCLSVCVPGVAGRKGGLRLLRGHLAAPLISPARCLFCPFLTKGAQVPPRVRREGALLLFNRHRCGPRGFGRGVSPLLATRAHRSE